ncbi:hypothetical protein ACIRTB_20930 [Streptomyces sp. NPDC101158]|uniref:hypothetical protein n=1 Tax=Streptomyces sp. NPDC101158 TaxID=3366117 RepID=UPI0038243C6D
MAQRMSDQLTVISAACAGTLLTYQVWQSDAALFATATVALLAATNVAWTVDALRRNRTKDVVTCPTPGCGVSVAMTGATPGERARMTAYGVDHSRHGGAA